MGGRISDRSLARNFLLEAWILFVVVLCLRLLWGEVLPFPVVAMDEQAHYSYTLDLMTRHHWWPDFRHFYMFDTSTGRPTAEPNYLPHPPTFYWLMKAVQSAFPTTHLALYRLPSLLMTVIALGIYARIGYLLALPPLATGIYALYPLLLNVHLLSGFYSNDASTLLGGAVCCLGSFHWLKSAGDFRRGALLMALGMAGASVKLNAFLLVGFYCFFVLAMRPAVLKRLPRWWFAAAVLELGVLFLPYGYFWIHDGRMAPNTPGQVYMLYHTGQITGWLQAPRLHFFPWLLTVLSNFADQFPDRREWTFIPLLWLVFSFLAFVKPGRPVPEAETAALPGMIRAGLFSTVLVLIAHLAFSWPRYVAYGWLRDTQLRYYFPLLPAYGTAATAGYLLLSRRLGSIKSS